MSVKKVCFIYTGWCSCLDTFSSNSPFFSSLRNLKEIPLISTKSNAKSKIERTRAQENLAPTSFPKDIKIS